jgi:hypothetical protein
LGARYRSEMFEESIMQRPRAVVECFELPLEPGAPP